MKSEEFTKLEEQLEAFETDAQLLRWIYEHLEWDGDGYWLPDICIRERAFGQAECPKPTMHEFRELLSKRARTVSTTD